MQRLVAGFLFLLFTGVAWGDPPRWTEVRSPHFLVLTNSSEKDGRHVAGQLERMRAVFHTLLPASNDDNEPPITVFALRDKKSFESLEPAEYLKKGQLTLAGYFLRGQQNTYVLLRLDSEGEHPYATVYHEYTHYMMRKAEAWIPLWLNEGLAEFYQNTDIDDKEVHLGQPSAYDIQYLRQNRLVPLTTLLTVDHSSPYYHDEQKGSVFYAESWALTHYLEINDFEHKTQSIQDYARNMVKGEDSVTAAQHAFGDLKKLQQALDNYVSQGNFQMFRLKQATVVNEASFGAKPIAMADVDAQRAGVLLGTGRKQDAQTLLESVLQSDPKNALAHETMGMLKYGEGETTEAKRWYGEAVALDPTSYRANYYFAMLCLWTGDHGHDEEVERDLRAAIQLAPKFAPSYDALASFYAQRREKLEEAHLLTIEAVQLDPRNLQYRMNAAQVLAVDNQVESAIGVLKLAKKLAKSPTEEGMVDVRIAELESRLAATKGQEQEGNAGVRTTLSASGAEVKTIVIGRSADAPPEHVYPAGVASGRRHTVSGVISEVKCLYPTILLLNLNQTGKVVPLYTNNYFKVDFTALNYEAKGDLSPCSAINGMKAKVVYADVTDPTVVGQIVSIELSK